MSRKIAHMVWKMPAGKWAVKKHFVGAWRIIELDGYTADYVDLCCPAKMKISTRGSGSFDFGAVGAEIDGRMDDLADTVFRFSFEGEDEGDPFIGYGYCLVEGDQMSGRLFRHFGGNFSFRARKMKKEKQPNQPPEPSRSARGSAETLAKENEI